MPLILSLSGSCSQQMASRDVERPAGLLRHDSIERGVDLEDVVVVEAILERELPVAGELSGDVALQS